MFKRIFANADTTFLEGLSHEALEELSLYVDVAADPLGEVRLVVQQLDHLTLEGVGEGVDLFTPENIKK
jgi:hypothetical protein